MQIHRLAVPLAAVLLAVPAVGQSYLTTPPGYVSVDGGQRGGGTFSGYSYYMGGYPTMRYQVVDAELPAGLHVIKDVAVRLDYRSHATSTAMGRSWTGATLDLSDGDYATMGSTYAANQLSTPTRVFSGSVTWPSMTGNPSSNPAPWMSFPFNQASLYIHSGAKHLCQTYEFQGGTLANAGPWAGTSLSLYFLDGEYAVTAVTYGRNVYKYIGTGTGDCKDPGASSTYAEGPVQVGLYGPASPTYTNTAQLQVFGSGTAPNATVIHAFGFNGSVPGTATQAFFECYNLMIDLSQVALYVTDTTNATGGRNWQYIKIGDLPTLAPLGSTVSIWSQAAWTHSQTRRLGLTTAERCTPDFAYKLAKDLAKRKVVYRYDTSATGFAPSDSPFLIPIFRYTN